MKLGDVYTEGIRNITQLDMDTADDMGYVIKLLALAHRTPEGIDVRVHPTMLPKAHQMAMVNGVYNAIYVTGAPWARPCSSARRRCGSGRCGGYGRRA